MVQKENSLGHNLEKWGVFFSSDFVTQYFVDIFSEPPKGLCTIKFRNCSKRHQNNRSSVSFHKN